MKKVYNLKERVQVYLQTKSGVLALRSLWWVEQSHTDRFPHFQLLKRIKSYLNALLFTCVITKVLERHSVMMCGGEVL